MTARRVLLTGAGGRIGTAFCNLAGDRYTLRLADRRDVAPTTSSEETLTFDIADAAACQEACRDVDTVIHLAADPSWQADFYGSLLENNIKGTYNIFRAAKDQGCRRVIYASSINAVDGYPRDRQVTPADPVHPPNMYGVSKCFGEAVASYFAHTEGLSSIVVRIGTFYGPNLPAQITARNLNTLVSHRDLTQLLVRCIETPDIPFAIVHGVSDNRYKRLDITSARELLGYTPQDDAFRLFDIPLPE